MRPCDQTPWRRCCYIMDVNDCPIAMSRGVLDGFEVTAAANTTIFLDRMMRKGQEAWARRAAKRRMR